MPRFRLRTMMLVMLVTWVALFASWTVWSRSPRHLRHMKAAVDYAVLAKMTRFILTSQEKQVRGFEEWKHQGDDRTIDLDILIRASRQQADLSRRRLARYERLKENHIRAAKYPWVSGPPTPK
jgi:hypothetical protein